MPRAGTEMRAGAFRRARRRQKGDVLGIVVQKTEGATVKQGSERGDCPLVRCDACGRFVNRRSNGRVAWDPGQNVTCLDVAFLHEGCVEAHRKEREVDLEVDELARGLDELARFAPSSGGT